MAHAMPRPQASAGTEYEAQGPSTMPQNVTKSDIGSKLQRDGWYNARYRSLLLQLEATPFVSTVHAVEAATRERVKNRSCYQT